MKKFILGNARKLPFGKVLVSEIYYKFFAAKFINNAYVAMYKLVDGKTPAVFMGEGWDGKLTLPGGTMDARDKSSRDTALRELEEETQIVLFPHELPESIIACSKWSIPKRWYRRRRHFFSILYILDRDVNTRFDGIFSPRPAKDKETLGFHWLTLDDLENEDISRRIPGNATSGHEYLVRTALAYIADSMGPSIRLHGFSPASPH